MSYLWCEILPESKYSAFKMSNRNAPYAALCDDHKLQAVMVSCTKTLFFTHIVLSIFHPLILRTKTLALTSATILLLSGYTLFNSTLFAH